MLLRKLNKEEDKAQVWAVVPKGKNTNESSEIFNIDKMNSLSKPHRFPCGYAFF
jgi:hypothetical protein